MFASPLLRFDDIDELPFSPTITDINVKLEAAQGLSLSITPKKKAEVFLYKDECTKIWNVNKKRLGYRPWDGEETWDDYSDEVLNPLKETLLKETDEVIYAARAMNYGEFHRLLYLAYPWLQSLEKRVRTARRDGPVSISDWSLKAPAFDKADDSPLKRVPLTPETPVRKQKRPREETEVEEAETRSPQRAGYHLLTDEMEAQCTRLAAEVASMKRKCSDLRDENEEIQRELGKMKESEAAARDDCRRIEESFSTMKRVAEKAETALANLEGPMKELFSMMGRL
ncbi:hypothetical protein F5146DRAFT_995349 [Armillaria mellea]|nr:hypothetical protein F5146DRAFT_995349 [Armillaria mellea]